MPTYYGHLKSDGTRQLLIDHIQNVAQLSQRFAEMFTDDNQFIQTSYLCGLLHDIGKYRDEFQEYLLGFRERGLDTQHSIFGAAIAFTQFQQYFIALCIQGHHSGLHDCHQLRNDINKIEENLETIFDRFKADAGEISIPQMEKSSSDILSLEFKIRMLFSCLIDADWLDTAQFGGIHVPSPNRLHANHLLDQLLAYVSQFPRKANSNLNEIRHSIFQTCLNAGSQPAGFYSLTVPTGGGKTLSMMAFALQHALTHDMRRVIVVIPYLSIIEQNAKIYRTIFGEEVVVEHHSSVKIEEGAGTEEQQKEKEWERKLSVENWDAPLLVTTSVQFIESLFSNKPGRCRKLHNIANSVILFDECQLIPCHLLKPCLDVFQELQSNYRCTILFSSATQPGFTCKNMASLFKGRSIHKIIPHSDNLYMSLKRVHYHLDLLDETLSWDGLTQHIIQHPQQQVLIVTNIRKHAFDLHEHLTSNLVNDHSFVFHLSSAMCAEHRSDILGNKESQDVCTVHGRLNRGLPCYLVSTQLVEAGVDIDFPIVYRALAPLDSIVQAAGRCNREGLFENGEVYLFKPDASPALPPGLYTTATDLTAGLLNQLTVEELTCDPTIFENYFNQLYPLTNTGDEIQQMRRELRFQEVSKKAKVIKNNMVAIIVPYGDARGRIRTIEKEKHFTHLDMRFFQRYMVNVQQRDFEKLQKLGGVKNLLPWIEIPVLTDGFYHTTFGVLIEQRPVEDLIV